MSRSKWKGPYINEQLLSNQSLIESSSKNITNIIKTTSRNSEIIYGFVGLTFDVYTGKTFLKLEITEEMVGHKFGEFAFTRTHSPPKKKKIKRKIAFKKVVKNGTKN
uniref:Small ribosomal subunit protein uS19c n=1 Tax=Eunotia naegelii TaxID=1458866 RepID=A0A2U9GI07_9STRA|nr:ribosomal protein S19 [Eunotia naegelii]AWQ64106.1 ribosomal protein S19 [Eunotia naegelii]